MTRRQQLRCKEWVWRLRGLRLEERRLAGARPVCRSSKPLSPCEDSRCSPFIPASLNEFITLWGSCLPKCNVLPLLSVWRASIESTFIILTFRRPQREASFPDSLLSADFCASRWERRRVFSFPPPFIKFCSRGVDKKASSGGNIESKWKSIRPWPWGDMGRRRVKIRERKRCRKSQVTTFVLLLDLMVGFWDYSFLNVSNW